MITHLLHTLLSIHTCCLNIDKAIDMSQLAGQLIMSPHITQGLALIGTTLGRDKVSLPAQLTISAPPCWYIEERGRGKGQIQAMKGPKDHGTLCYGYLFLAMVLTTRTGIPIDPISRTSHRMAADQEREYRRWGPV